MRLTLPDAVIVAALLLSGWSPQGAQAQATTFRDSAGVRIIENPSRRTARIVFRLGDKPTLEVGGTEENPDLEFDHNQGYLRAVRLSDGRLVVIDVTRIHFFGADGKRQKIVGRRGAGPEEFNYLDAICRTRGDTIVASDSRNRRLAILDKNGSIVRTVLQGDNGSAPFDACFDDGTFVLERDVGEFVRGAARTLRLTRVRTDGSVANVIGELPGFAFDMVTQAEGTLLPAGQLLYYGNGMVSDVQLYNLAGRLVRVVRTDDPPVPISDAEAEERMSLTIPRNVSAAERSARMDKMKAMPHAKSWPTYRRFHVGADGRLWVQDFNTDSRAPVGWTAFDSAGRMIGKLVFPALREGERGPQVIGFGRDDILVRRFDADRASYLSVYRLLRVDPQRP